jgi:general secretion pathway protein G/type IV pilus assembly protein PilA
VKMKTENNQGGFTLIELMVVTLILGVLAALALPAYASMIRRARYAEAKHQMGIMAREIQAYHIENGQYPFDVGPNIKPDGIVNWPDDVPYDSSYDYDHWGVGGDKCYVQIGYAGESRSRAYPSHTANVPQSGFREFGDDLVLGIALYDCNRERGSIRK